jgi:hypothetical protein
LEAFIYAFGQSVISNIVYGQPIALLGSDGNFLLLWLAWYCKHFGLTKGI